MVAEKMMRTQAALNSVVGLYDICTIVIHRKRYVCAQKVSKLLCRAEKLRCRGSGDAFCSPVAALSKGKKTWTKTGRSSQ